MMEELKNLIPSSIHEKLLNGNIDSIFTLLTTQHNDIEQSTGLPTETIEKVIKIAAELTLKNKLVTADKLPIWERLSTGCKSIDFITRGGIPLNGITEIVGCSGVGKTQICLQLAIMAQLPRPLGGLNCGVIYICTEDSFPAKRFNQLSKTFQAKYNLQNTIDFESNVFLQHIADYEQLRRCIFIHVPNLVSQKIIGLIIIDSIAGVFRSENSNVIYSNRSQQFVEIVQKLNTLSSSNKLGIVCVNQVTHNTTIEKTEPCLGLSWSNLVNSRFNVTRYNDCPFREFEIVFAPDLAYNSCKFKINPDGITDC